LEVHPVDADSPFALGGTDIQVLPFAVRHPGGGLGYRIQADGAAVAYTGDHAIDRQAGPEHPQEKAWLKSADIAIVDATFCLAENAGSDWHSAWEDWIGIAEEARVRQLVLSHHLPARSDAEIDRIVRAAARLAQGSSLRVYAAREGAMFLPEGPADASAGFCSDWLAHAMDGIWQSCDPRTVLDALLAEARKIAQAESGTAFLLENGGLSCYCAQTDVHDPDDAARRLAYLSIRLPLGGQSIAGYAAQSGQMQNVPDVARLPAGSPFAFHGAFDQVSGQASRSVLSIPFFQVTGETMGTLQLINRRSAEGKALPFSAADATAVQALVRAASPAIERSRMHMRTIFNMVQMSALHDPMETHAHAERVGALAAEIYQQWARNHRIEPETLRHDKGLIRLAAMLHDIGKVGISEAILQKPGKLSEEEFTIIRSHPRLGEALLADDPSELARMARLITRHHHQKWNGKGYADSGPEGVLAGIEIPFPARITSIADVFDALLSPRCYKAPWTFDDALLFMFDRSGQDFDPELVDCFQAVLETVKAIYKRYPEAGVLQVEL
jgi:response regulator RpfG family c-di-GMP phosphodiesterase